MPLRGVRCADAVDAVTVSAVVAGPEAVDTETGLKVQLIPAGAVQEKLTVPWNPLVGLAVSEKKAGLSAVMVSLGTEVDREKSGEASLSTEIAPSTPWFPPARLATM